MTIVKRLIWIGLLVVVAFVFFNIRLFSIPSGSMVPTVRVGDYVLVWKMRYGWSKYSLPFSPELFSGRIWPAEPARGDVIVFKDPRDSATDYIKRVVGLPGDRVRMQDGRLMINGRLVAREPIGTEPMMDAFGRVTDVSIYRETLGAVQHDIAERDGDSGSLDNTQEFVVPDGQYFAMGDNRDNSNDSRSPTGVGFVPFDNLIGKVEYVLFSIPPDRNDPEAVSPQGGRFLIPVR